MNRELYDFALEVYERSLQIEDSLADIGFQSCSFNLTSVSMSAILNAIGVDELEQTELRKVDNWEGLDYYIPISGGKLYTNSIMDDIQSFVYDRPKSEEHFVWQKENLWKFFKDLNSAKGTK